MSTTEAYPAGGMFPARAAADSGSGLYKLVKQVHNGPMHAPTDLEVSRIEASFLGPDLTDSGLLQISGNEEEERKALLERMEAYDMMLSRIESQQQLHKETTLMNGSDVNTATNSGEAKLTIDFDAQVTSQGYEVLDSTARKSTNNYLTYQGGDFGGFNDWDLVGEDDEDDNDADLLCDWAPGALQSDGSMGLVDSEGTCVLAPAPSADASILDSTLTSWNMTAGDPGAQRKAMMQGRLKFAMRRRMQGAAALGEEPCLSDSWQQQAAAAASDSTDSSITALREQYHAVFGKQTSSNNRQWLLRRLAEINTYGHEDQLEDHAHGGDYSGQHSTGSGSEMEDGNSPMIAGSATGMQRNRFFGMGDSADHGMAGSGRQGGIAQGFPRSAGKRQVKPNRHFKEETVNGRRGARVKPHDQRSPTRGKGHHKRSRDTDTHSAEGAKTDGSAASGKKYKKGHHAHSDSDDLSSGEEPPVKSRNNSLAAQQHRKPTPSQRKMQAESNGTPGANGRRSKHHNPWTLEEAVALVDGVAKCGGGKWADIKKLGFPAIEHRTAVDLKDKWRNLLRIAMLPHQPVKNAGDKKREIPPELLARVRELAAKQAKKQAQDGRSRNGGRA